MIQSLLLALILYLMPVAGPVDINSGDVYETCTEVGCAVIGNEYCGTVGIIDGQEMYVVRCVIMVITPEKN